MAKPGRRKQDPLEWEIEAALCPGELIDSEGKDAFVEGLEAVGRKVAAARKAEPARAAALYAAFMAGCQAKADELRDYNPGLEALVLGLCVAWIKASRAAGGPSEETAATLLAWMEGDRYRQLMELRDPIPRALAKAQAGALERALLQRYAAAGTFGGQAGGPPCRRSIYADALRAFYAGRKDADGYVRFAEQDGLTGKDCLAVAGLFRDRGSLGDALAWVERGLGPGGGAPDKSLEEARLAELKRGLLAKLGRGEEALQCAWDGYLRRPDEYTYDELMQYVPRAARADWHEKAMDAAKGKDLSDAIRLYVRAKETVRLGAFIAAQQDAALVGTSHTVLEPAARLMERVHPAVAARLWRAQGMRIVEAAKSRYNNAALFDFQKAKRCYERAGQAGQWRNLVAEVRARHGRKGGFMPDFEAIVADAPPAPRTPFLDAAKERWGRKG